MEIETKGRRKNDVCRKLKVLADQKRLAVMECLLEQPSHVGRLGEILKVEQSLLSHHLRVLRDAGLVTAARDGKAVLYSVSPEAKVESGRAINLGCCQLRFNPGQFPVKSVKTSVV